MALSLLRRTGPSIRPAYIPSASRLASSKRDLQPKPAPVIKPTAPSPVAQFNFNPWSQHFSGSWKARALFQSAVYAFGILVAAKVFDSYLYPEDNEKSPRYASRKEAKLAIDELHAAFPAPNDVSTDPDTLRTYGFSENSYHPASPHTVVPSRFDPSLLTMSSKS
ncbi:hypothetical protein H0H92_013411 [Tricholoma furcatifolium]|nr:hypothetical protein H0H92_013411 [Tricholoma furcatifolium]